MAENILNTPEGNIVKLGEKDYKLSSLNLNIMADIEEEFDCDFMNLGKILTKENSKTCSAIRKLLYIFLRRNYPDLTINDMADMVTMDNLAEVSRIIAHAQMGIRIPA